MQRFCFFFIAIKQFLIQKKSLDEMNCARKCNGISWNHSFFSYAFEYIELNLVLQHRVYNFFLIENRFNSRQRKNCIKFIKLIIMKKKPQFNFIKLRSNDGNK